MLFCCLARYRTATPDSYDVIFESLLTRDPEHRMCRLYGFHASHPTTPSCELLEAQNSLLAQSVEDERGLANLHGWGIGHVLSDGSLACERQADPAHESEEYRRHATSIESISVVAHVRRATIGAPRLVNTHPFRADGSLLVHNGHLGAFDRVRPRMLEAMGPEWADSVAGDTDSEHFFRLLMSRLDGRSPGAMVDVLADTANDVVGWCRAEGADAELNVIWAVGEELVGTRLGPGLHAIERREPYTCPVCEKTHGPADVDDYRAVVVASERITGEDWFAVQDGRIWWIDADFRFRSREL